MPASDLDLTNLPRFLTHLGAASRDPDAAEFARMLLSEGAEIVTFWGPEQMDVWALSLRRGRYLVDFGVERGFPDEVRVRSDADAQSAVLLRLAVLGWARATGVAVTYDDPETLGFSLRDHGIDTLDWLEAGGEDTARRIHDAWLEYRQHYFSGARRTPDDARKIADLGIRLVEEAAAPQA